MLLLDDLLLAPFRGLLWIVDKVHDAAQEEMAGEADAIVEELRQLYLMLEGGQLTEAEFNTHERKLLDRLDAIEARESHAEQEGGEENVEDGAEEHEDTQVDGPREGSDE